MEDALAHPLSGEQRRGVLNRLWQVEDDRPQSLVPAAKSNRIVAAGPPDIEHPLGVLRHRYPSHRLAGRGVRHRAHAALEQVPLLLIGHRVELNRLAGAHLVLSALQQVPELEQQLVGDRVSALAQQPLARHRGQRIAAIVRA
jgi:hypothetical protein